MANRHRPNVANNCFLSSRYKTVAAAADDDDDDDDDDG